jgi:uncharacterized protein (TIGR03435 family)
MPPRLWIAAALIFGGLPVCAQPAAPPRSFEAAVVKSSKRWTPFRMSGGPGGRDPAQIVYTGVTLEDMALEAYGIRAYQLRGPSWLDFEHYDVAAKIPPGASQEDFQAMLQGLLAERFGMAVHRETAEGRNYRLVVDKGGPKLQSPTNGAPAERATMSTESDGSVKIVDNALGRPVTLSGKNLVVLVTFGRVLVLAHSQTVSALADRLAIFMDGPVRDLTGIAGDYDFSVDFALPPGARRPPAGPAGENAAPGDAEPPLTVFQALRERLGLRLETVRGPIDLVVVDRAEKIPTEN